MNDLLIINQDKALEGLDKDIQVQLKPMTTAIGQALPELKRGTENFGKRQSQLMDNMLTVSHPTPLRNMRQILSESNRTLEALREAYFNQKKKQIQYQIKLRDAEASEGLESDLLRIEAEELQAQIESSKTYISGAIRKLANYVEQYNSLTEKIKNEQGVTEFSEIDFEQEEEKYHIKTAFSQARNALLSRGVIDEGNQIYLQQLGINGNVALKCLQGYTLKETEMMKRGQEPSNQMWLDFLEEMYQKFKGCTAEYAEYKGMTTLSEDSVIQPKLQQGEA